MKTINDILIDRKTTREVKNALGQRVREKVDIKVKRKVQTIQGGQRFLHYLVDTLVVIGIYYLFVFSGLMHPSADNSWFYINTASVHISIGYQSYGIMAVYYFILEMTTGRTIGKMVVSNSYVINKFAEKPSVSDLILRTLFRWVPFEPFSCLSDRGWHDKWSNSWVVSKEEMLYLKQQLGEEDFSEEEILDA